MRAASAQDGRASVPAVVAGVAEAMATMPSRTVFFFFFFLVFFFFTHIFTPFFFFFF